MAQTILIRSPTAIYGHINKEERDVFNIEPLGGDRVLFKLEGTDSWMDDLDIEWGRAGPTPCC